MSGLWDSPPLFQLALSVLGSIAIVALGFCACRSLLLRFGVTSGGAAFAFALASLAWIADFGGRPAHDVRVGAALCGALWVLIFFAGKRALELHLDRQALAIGAALVAAISTVSFTTILWDEGNGHGPMAYAAATGVLPIEHPSVLNMQFPYHVAFDILAGLFANLGVRPIETALDLTTLLTAVALLWCLYDVGFAFGGRRVAQLTMVTALLSHGPLSVFGSGILDLDLPTIGDFGGPWLAPPPPVSSFLQHPQGFSMSVGLAVLLLAAATDVRARGAALVLLLMLAQVNIAAFVLVFFGSAFMCLRRPHLAAFVVAYVVVGLAAIATSPFSGSGGHLVPGGFFRSVPNAVLGMVVFFPAVLLAVPLAVRARVGLGSLASGLLFASLVGVVLGNCLHYIYSWDIVKFLTIGAYFSIIVVTWLSSGSSLLSRFSRFVLISGCGIGLLWILRFGVLNGNVFPHCDEKREPFSFLAARAIGPHLSAYDCVVTIDTRLAEGGIRVGGLDPVLHPEWAFDRGWADRQFKMWKAATSGNVQAIRAMGCRWGFMPEVDAAVVPVETVVYEGTTWTFFSLE